MAERTSSGASRASVAAGAAKAGAGLILFTLATGQFLMTLDTSVMNVSIATVAKDLGTTVTGVQTAITLYTLVMASLMVLGGKIGSIIGRKRAFAIGCIIYGCGSMTTALSPNLTVLIIGWSFLEGIGAVLIMPAIVGLVAGNFPPAARAKAYGLIAAAGADRRRRRPRDRRLHDDLLLLALRVRRRGPHRDRHPLPGAPRRRRAGRRAAELDLIGAAISSAGLALVVLGVLKSSTWGWLLPKEGATSLFGLSLTHLVHHRRPLCCGCSCAGRPPGEGGKEPLISPALLRVRQLTRWAHHVPVPVPDPGGAVLHRAAVPVGRAGPVADGHGRAPAAALALAAPRRGRRPRLFPRANPRRVVRIGMLALIAGILVLIASLQVGADSSIVFVPMLIIGFGIGALASQLGNVTVSSVPTTRAPRSAACRTPPASSAPRSARRWPARS